MDPITRWGEGILTEKELPTDAPRVTLKPTSEEDLPLLLKLWNDGRVMKFVGFPNGLGYDESRMLKWFARMKTDPDFRHFVVIAPGVGFCGEVCFRVDRAHRRAGLDVKFMPEARGKGLAQAALGMVIDLAFSTVQDVDEVWVEPWPENLAAQNLYRRCGLHPKPRPPDIGHDGPSYWARERTTPS